MSSIKDQIRAEIERYKKSAIDAYDPHDEYADFYYGKLVMCDDLITIIDSLPDEHRDLATKAKEFLEALSETPYNNTPITNAQVVTRELLTFFKSPSEYNPDNIADEPTSMTEEILEGKIGGTPQKVTLIPEGLEAEISEWMKNGPHTNFPWCAVTDAIEITARHFAEWGAEHAKKKEYGQTEQGGADSN